MTSRNLALILLGSLAVGLTAMLLAEIFASNFSTGSMVAIARRHPTAPAAASAPTPDQAAAWAAALLDRPLFSSSRRSPGAAASERAGAATGDLPRLAGILLSRGTRQAIFQPAGGDKPISVGEGEAIGRWTVRGIGAGGVTVTGPGGTQTLAPAIDPTRPVSTVPMPPPLPAAAPGAPPQASPGTLPPVPAALQRSLDRMTPAGRTTP